MPGHVDEKGENGTSGAWGLEGSEKCAFRLSGLSVGSCGRWDEAVQENGFV